MGAVRHEVEHELSAFFSRKRRMARRVHEASVQLVDQIASLTLRPAKRLRPFLCWVGYEASKIKDQKSKIKNTEERSKIVIPSCLTQAMVGIELFHSFALIHDDIMDEDFKRRGGPTVHEYFRKEKGKRKKENGEDAKHFGESMAILAGDLALVWADELMGSLSTSDVDAWRLYQQMKEKIIYGQGLDVAHKARVVAVNQEQINEIKSAWYSVIYPLEIGASLGGAKGPMLAALRAYGLPVGFAFQLRDDAMDSEISPSDFSRASVRLAAQARGAIQKIPTSPLMRELLEELSQFVLTRTT